MFLDLKIGFLNGVFLIPLIVEPGVGGRGVVKGETNLKLLDLVDGLLLKGVTNELGFLIIVEGCSVFEGVVKGESPP